MIMTSGVNFGMKRSMPHLLGISFGFPLMAILLGLGFNNLLSMYPIIHESIKVIGILYLVYLALLIAHSSPRSLESNVTKPISFIKAALFQWLNPKAWIMAIGAISAYTTVSSNFLIQVLYIVAIPCLCLWLFFGATLKKYLTSSKHQNIFNRAMAMLLVISVLPALLSMVIERVT